MTQKEYIEKRMELLRQSMQEEGLAGFIVPTGDPHNSEYTPEYWKIREWLTGFNGSAGTAVILKNKAALWTDSRYFLAAEEALAGIPFKLMRDGEPATPSIAEWLSENFPKEGGTIGFVGEMVTIDFREALEKELPENISLCSLPDLFNELWDERPPLPKSPLTILDETLTGSSVGEKFAYIRKKLGLTNGDYYLMNDLAGIAYVLNLRGEDIPYNPFFVSYLLLGAHNAILFIDSEKITPEVAEHLNAFNVACEDYDELIATLSELENYTINIPDSLNCEISDMIDLLEIPTRHAPDIALEMRAIKNEAEQTGFRDAMLHDGRALVRFRRWLDESVKLGGVTEISADRKLTELRSEEEGFAGLSFETIAAYEAHGAIVHYEATVETDVELQSKGFLLLDTGAHYKNGTTDITRTIALGEVTDEQRRVYTLVLKGHIALSACQFPTGTNGLQLDTTARYAMWKEGYDFGHGTGHGVGTRLGVHEGPHQIRKDKRACSAVPLQAGMTVTDEPGIYIPGKFGVRIENTLLVQKGATTPFGTFLCFEPLTLCPIDTAAIDFTMMNHEEIAWLNNYHSKVKELLLPTLSDPADIAWLENATKEIHQTS